MLSWKTKNQIVDLNNPDFGQIIALIISTKSPVTSQQGPETRDQRPESIWVQDGDPESHFSWKTC